MKKILICDYESALEENYDITLEALKETLGEEFSSYDIKVVAFTSKELLIKDLLDVEGLITGFLEVDEEILKEARHLKCISVSGVGYGNIDCDAANTYGIKVCHIREYCTEEVAEHTFALIGALNRHLKFYEKDIEENKNWQYYNISGGSCLKNKTLSIFGYGRIGRRVAEIARGYGMRVLAVDPFADSKEAKQCGVEIVTAEIALKEGDVISNHMNLTEENRYFFRRETFEKMEKHPVFINVGRGGCVREEDLYDALLSGAVSAAGLDVLEAEEPDLEHCRFIGMNEVILTPHSAFYSDDSLEALQKISGANLGNYLKGNYDDIFAIVRECAS